MATRLYDDAVMEPARNLIHPTEDDIPKKPKRPKKGKIVVIIAVVVVVLVVAIAGDALITHTHYTVHVAVMSESTAASFAGHGFISRFNNGTGGNVIPYVIQNENVFYNNNSTGSLIMIQSTGFINQSTAAYFYNRDYQGLRQGPNNTIIQGIINGTYEDFNFCYLVFNNSGGNNILNMETIGVSGSFSFEILVGGIPHSNYLPLIHAEIQAMTS